MTDKIVARLYKVVHILWNFVIACFWKPIQQLLFPVPSPKYSGNEGVKPVHEIPGPSGLPILGDALTLNKFGGSEKIQDYIAHLHEQYGHIVRVQLGNQKFVFIDDIPLFNELLKNQPRQPHSFKFPASMEWMKIYNLQRGLFFMNGDLWEENRSLMTKVLLKDTGSFMSAVFHHTTPIFQRWMSRWKIAAAKSGDGLIPGVLTDCYELFIEGFGTISYGPNFNKYLKKTEYDLHTLAKNAIDLNNETYKLTAYPIGLAKLLGLKCWKMYKEYTLANVTTGREITMMALDDLQNASDGGSIEDFGLVFRMKKTHQLTDEQVAIHCSDFTFDISDPVSVTMLWCLLSLGTNMRVQSKVHEEIVAVCGGEIRPIGYSDLNRMPYLCATVKEIQRLYPIAYMVLRDIVEPTTVGGYEIPAGYTFALSTLVAQKCSKYFPSPSDLVPERWLTESKGMTPGDVPYLTYGFGKRTCVGKPLAINFLRLFVANVVQNFEIVSDEVNIKVKTILYPDGDIRVRLKTRTPVQAN